MPKCVVNRCTLRAALARRAPASGHSRLFSWASALSSAPFGFSLTIMWAEVWKTFPFSFDDNSSRTYIREIVSFFTCTIHFVLFVCVGVQRSINIARTFDRLSKCSHIREQSDLQVRSQWGALGKLILTIKTTLFEICTMTHRDAKIN